jgi:hypothetical protein
MLWVLPGFFPRVNVELDNGTNNDFRLSSPCFQGLGTKGQPVFVSRGVSQEAMHPAIHEYQRAGSRNVGMG